MLFKEMLIKRYKEMPTMNHVHTYVRYKARPGYYRCDAPDCTHFLDKENVQGKLSRCTVCGDQMILSREDLRRARPKCMNCSNTKTAKMHRKAQELTRYLGTDRFDTLGIFNTPTEAQFPLLDSSIDNEEDLEELDDKPEDKWRLSK